MTIIYTKYGNPYITGVYKQGEEKSAKVDLSSGSRDLQASRGSKNSSHRGRKPK